MPLRWQSLWERMTVVEQNRFLRYLMSPYLNADQRLLQLARLCMEHPALAPDREQCHAWLFPDKDFDYFRISNLLSDFHQHLQRFHALEAWLQDDARQESDKLAAMRRLDQSASFLHLLRQQDKRLRKRAIWTEQDWLRHSQGQEEADTYSVARGERRATEHLSAAIASLEVAQQLRMLQRVCQWLNRQTLLPELEPQPAVQRFLDSMDYWREALSQYPLILLYGLVLDLLCDPHREAAYHDLKAVLQQHEQQLPPEDLGTLFQYIRNYCIRRSNEGHNHFLRELFWVYQQMLARDLLLQEGWLSHGDVKNIVSLGIRLQEFRWTEQFLLDAAEKIVPGHRHNAVQYNRAHLAYARGHYQQARRLLSAVVLEDIFYDLGARTILLKCYLEEGDYTGVDHQLRIFAAWLRRNRRLSQAQRRGHEQFLRVMRKLLRYLEQPLSPKQRQRLQQDIGEALQQPGLSQAGWLRQQWEGAQRQGDA